MAFYRLLPSAQILYDDSGATIIDMFSFSRSNYTLEEAKRLKHILNDDISDAELDEQDNIMLSELFNAGYCYRYEKNIHNDLFQGKKNPEIRGLNEEIPVFSHVFFEVGYDPNLGTNNNLYGCKLSGNWNYDHVDQEVHLDIEKTVERISKLFIDKVVLSGGSPLSKNNNAIMTLEYIELIKKYCMGKVKIEVIAPISTISEEILDYMKKEKAVINFTIDSVEKIESAMAFIKEHGDVCMRFTSLVSLPYYFEDMCHEINVELERINGNLTNRICENDYSERMKRETVNYWDNHRFNSCLKNKMAISLDGKLRPCPMIEESIADLRRETIDAAFQEQRLDKYWRFTKDLIPMCSKCRNRFICEDCAFLEHMVFSHGIDGSIMCNREY
ncbi:MAG: hypothetical protein K6F84_04485 [Lachnospiraceae bacterium]|nr:hypothetical protein [Lachnospiraceae bacterium]